MTGVLVAVLLAAAVLIGNPSLLFPLLPRGAPAFLGPGARISPTELSQPAGSGRRRGEQAQPRPKFGRWASGRPSVDLSDLPLHLHQLAGLLSAGRAPHQLWADAAGLERDTTNVSSGGNGRRSKSREAGNSRWVAPVLEAAARAASLGLSPVPVFTAAAREEGRGSPAALRRVWAELAACLLVSERSGAPLAGVLSRYAYSLEAAQDADDARRSALAGPQATVRLLSWLPLGGLGLGYLLGTDPLSILVGTTGGRLAGVIGAVFWSAGFFWSRKLVQRAERAVS